MSKADRESWSGASLRRREAGGRGGTGIPGVSTIVLPTGGHNFSTYAPTIVPALSWLGANSGL